MKSRISQTSADKIFISVAPFLDELADLGTFFIRKDRIGIDVPFVFLRNCTDNRSGVSVETKRGCVFGWICVKCCSYMGAKTGARLVS